MSNLKLKTKAPVNGSKIKGAEYASDAAGLLFKRKTNGSRKKKHMADIDIDSVENFDSRKLLKVLTEVKNGNFAVRMPIDEVGLNGKICDTLNDIINLNERMMFEFTKAGNIIGSNKNLENEIMVRKASEENVKELNRQLLENIDRLETANKDLDRFAFMSSHDLQEPLRKIRTFSDLLYSKYQNIFDEDATHYFSRIQKAAERMQILIKDILEFSKISSDKSSFVNTDLNMIVDEVLSEYESTIQEEKAVVKVQPLPSLDVNPGLMRPLFSNLIGNALKYRKKDMAPVINIYASQEVNAEGRNNSGNEKNGEKFCRIYVEDNGIGFDQKFAKQIFDMFVRLHGNKEYGGTGIGLALCKQIVEHHQGFISALSKENEGSTFIISLPVQ